jgi:hypothetical protein
LHTKQFVQQLDGVSRTAVGWEHREKLLQFVVVDPQAVAAGTFVEGQRWRAGMFHLYFMEGGVATWAEVGTAFWFRASLFLESQQGIVRVGAGTRHDRFQLAGIQPQSAALMTEIDIEVTEMQDEQWDIAFWTDASHIRHGLGCTMALVTWTRQALPM